MSIARTPPPMLQLKPAPAPAPAAPAADGEAWPREVELILSALEVGKHHDNRRRHPRKRYRVKAELRLFSDLPGVGPWKLFTRDVSARGVGCRPWSEP